MQVVAQNAASAPIRCGCSMHITYIPSNYLPTNHAKLTLRLALLISGLEEKGEEDARKREKEDKKRKRKERTAEKFKKPRPSAYDVTLHLDTLTSPQRCNLHHAWSGLRILQMYGLTE